MKNILLLLCALLSFSCSQKVSNKPYESSLTALDKLKSGNQRFVQGAPIHPDESLQRIKDLEKGQNPFATLVSCSDSRISSELIFDQGLGDLFCIRTAGNVIGDYELGSVEYAVKHLNCKLVIVLGHENCGAIGAFIASENHRHKNHIQNIIDYISSEKEEHAILDSIKSNPNLAVRANIRYGVSLLRESNPILKPLVDNKELTVIGAYYDMNTGKVTFYE